MIRSAKVMSGARKSWGSILPHILVAEFLPSELDGLSDAAVINEDSVAPIGSGAPAIATWNSDLCYRGFARAQDQLGHQEVLVRTKSSECLPALAYGTVSFQSRQDRALHLFQIWIEPATKVTQPSYEQIPF